MRVFAKTAFFFLLDFNAATAESDGDDGDDVASRLQKYGLAYYDVSRRIVRMNKRLKTEAGELLFEKRGHKWALTSFAFESWGINNR